VLKLKTGNFRLVTRSRKIGSPTQEATAIFDAVMPLLEREATGTDYRLIGVGCADLSPIDRTDMPDLLDPELLLRPQGEIRTEPAPAVQSSFITPRNPSPMLPGFERLHRRKKRR